MLFSNKIFQIKRKYRYGNSLVEGERIILEYFLSLFVRLLDFIHDFSVIFILIIYQGQQFVVFRDWYQFNVISFIDFLIYHNILITYSSNCTVSIFFWFCKNNRYMAYMFCLLLASTNQLKACYSKTQD